MKDTPHRTWRPILWAAASLWAAACVSEVGDPPSPAAASEALHADGEGASSVWLLMGDELVSGCSERMLREALHDGFSLEAIPEEPRFLLLLAEDGTPLCVEEAARLLAWLRQHHVDSTTLPDVGRQTPNLDDPHPWPIHPEEVQGDPHPWPIHPDGNEDETEDTPTSSSSSSSEMDMDDYRVQGHQGGAIPDEPDEAAPDVPGHPDDPPGS